MIQLVYSIQHKSWMAIVKDQGEKDFVANMPAID
jgi:hypothetical protein